MGSHYTQPARGIRKSSAIITVAAAATPETLFQRTTGGQNPRTVILRKVMAYSNVGNAVLDIGTGLAAAFANIIPSLAVINGVDNEWPEDEIAEVEVGADLTVQSSVLGIQVMVECEEIGS